MLPSNEGRGYVLRRIMRRAIRFGRLLNLPSPFMGQVSERVVELMGEVYPELVEARQFLAQVVTGEEERFADTLDHGLKLLGEELDYLKTHNLKILPGEVAFKLYDTYGFPLDLVQDTLREEGLVLDLEGFEDNMKRQREASRQSWRGGAAGEVPPVYQELAQWPPTHFLGYEALEGDSTILALITHEGHHEQAEPGEEVEVVTAATPFYGESGGQVGDTGLISGDGWRIRVTDTQRLPNDLFIHQGVVEEGTVKVNDEAVSFGGPGPAPQDRPAPHRHPYPPGGAAAAFGRTRQAVRLSGGHRSGCASISPTFKAIAPEEVEQIELDLNAEVAENLPVLTDRMSVAQALERGATALFEEKYGDEVRVVAIPGLSQELCGGTHVERTGDLGLCKITSEASVAAGIRRIEAVCGPEAVALTQEMGRELDQAAALLKGSRTDLIGPPG